MFGGCIGPRSKKLSVDTSSGLRLAASVVSPVFSWLKKPTAEEIFARYDEDKNGMLSTDEFAKFAAEALSHLPKEETEKLFACIDSDESGTVGLCELRAFLRSYNPETKGVQVKTALIVIDVQNDFITGALANADKSTAKIVPLINSIRDEFDVVVISYDWHPYHHCSFLESANDGEVALLSSPPAGGFTAFSEVKLKGDADRPAHDQTLYPRHAVQKTWGGEAAKELVVKEEDGKIYKGTKANIDSYSAFFDNIKANDTGLTAYLEARGVTHVYCCGLVFDICVMSTALHGAEAGFSTTVIEDASRPLMKDAVPGVKKELKEAGVKVVSSSEAAREAKKLTGRTLTLEQYIALVGKHDLAAKVHNETPIARSGSRRR